MSAGSAQNRAVLERCTRLHLDSAERVGAYRGLGVVGGLVGIGLVFAIALAAGGSMRAAITAIVASPLAFLAAVKLSHFFRGREDLVMSEKLAAALLGCAAAAHLASAPILAALDFACVGIGAFLVFGRLGCASAGCCFGRPARRGLVYTRAHAEAGFPRALVGVPLFPIQLVEAAVHAGLAATAALFAVMGVPGDALIAYLVGYSLLRLTTEIARGDDARLIAGRLSETQWLSLATLVGLAALVSNARWPILALALVGLLAALLAASRLPSARLIEEIAEAMRRLPPPSAELATAKTRRGIIVSRSCSGEVTHFAVSQTAGSLAGPCARQVAQIAAALSNSTARPIGIASAHHFEFIVRA